MILTSVPLEGQTPGSLWTSTVTVTPGGPTFTNTSTIPPTLTLVITDTATLIGADTATPTFTRTATLVPSATSNVATATFTTPNAPLNPQGGATKNGNKCDNIWFSWSYNPAWAIDPGSYPLQYQVYKYANYQGIVASNDPADTTWTTSLSLNNNGTITLGAVAIWAGPQGSHELWASFLCDKGDLIMTGSGVSP
jgi:hypothetical protein